MAILAFQRPEKVIVVESTASFGKFEFRPLEPGYAMTIGNALRRVLLSSLEGYAITTVKVDGVDHEFAAIPGVMEDMLEVVLNLKQIRFIRTVENQDFEKATINVAGVTELTAGYISNFLSSFKVLNPELVICHLAPGTKMQLTITIGKGRGYVPAEENAPANAEFGLLPIDSIHTPIVNVKYSREDYRVDWQQTKLCVLRCILLCRYIATALTNSDSELHLCTRCEMANNQLRIENLER